MHRVLERQSRRHHLDLDYIATPIASQQAQLHLASLDATTPKLNRIKNQSAYVLQILTSDLSRNLPTLYVKSLLFFFRGLRKCEYDAMNSNVSGIGCRRKAITEMSANSLPFFGKGTYKFLSAWETVRGFRYGWFWRCLGMRLWSEWGGAGLGLARRCGFLGRRQDYCSKEHCI